MKTFILLAPLTLVWFLPPIHQSQLYHHFANHTDYLGIPNFWNVISNLAFLIVAALAWPLAPKGINAFRVLLIGIALTTFGSAYYHAQPTDARLLWDRLPMTLVFMCVLTITIGDRIKPSLAHKLLWPLLAAGALSVLYWRISGDLRPYVIVQFYPLIAVPAMLSIPSEIAVISLPAQWSMIAFYALAKIAELVDSRFPTIPSGAHAWKHVLAAVGLLIYTQAFIRPKCPQR